MNSAQPESGRDAGSAIPPAGLASTEAALRLAAEGGNELSPPRRRSFARTLLEVLREPMFLLLAAAGGIYLLLGDAREAGMLLFFVALIIAITVVQQHKTERVLEALRDLSSPRALVLRDGREQRIAGREVVRGDILLLAEGDRVAADALLLSCNDLSADESLLTGESVPVRKRPRDGEDMPCRPGGDELPWVYAGSLIVQGGGVAEVTAIGSNSAIGRIGLSLEQAQPGPSPLQCEMRVLVRRLALLASALSVVLVLAYGIGQGNWPQALLAGITLAMSALPEEFPVILTVFLALGAWRISKSRVLTRRMDAIETLGATTVLCVDKTGTLTENRMAIHSLWRGGAALEVAGRSDLPEAWHELLEYAILASEREPFDPMERAFHELGRRSLDGSGHLHADWELVHEYSLSPDLLAMSHVWRGERAARHVVAAKGAPEAIIDLCHLPSRQAEEISRAAAEMADRGLRVLGVARARLEPGPWPAEQHDIAFEFVGLAGLRDPVRREVPEAVALCRGAGIRVVMITGDYPRTAQAIARELGLAADDALTGAEIEAMDEAGLRRQVRGVEVFARILPQQKLRLVEAFKANGEVVAMTGDGVNDAPALKSAHIGVAMGRRGTDVAREAASLVLLDDDFGAIVATVRLGRRIYDNLQKAMSYTLAVHVPIVGMALLPALLGQPLLFFPAHIVFLELIIDPACSIAFEAQPEEAGLMRRPPRDPARPLFGGRILALSLLQGLAALACCAATYAIGLLRGMEEGEVRAMVFIAMVVCNVALVLANRSLAHGAEGVFGAGNATAGWVVAGALAALALVMAAPGLRDLFRFGELTMLSAALGAGAGFCCLLASDRLKRIEGAAP